MTTDRLPTLYISHGGGPCFWTDLPAPFGPHAFDKLRNYLAGILDSLWVQPKSILVISAHWEEAYPTVSINTAPPMIFDYYGFPDQTYQLHYPASGSPELALRAKELLDKAGVPTKMDDKRGFDHGVFVPFLILDPTAQIPVVMLSLQKKLDPAFHYAMGAALAPLRDEGVLIIGSGNSYHNLESFFDGDQRDSVLFDQWLNSVITDPDIHARESGLIHWLSSPQARICHPREEHFMPLIVAAGAGDRDIGWNSFRDVIGHKAISCFAFGDMKRS